ncbi:ABC transporter ATP-binding protein [Sinomonas sp. JGH33]|uniref:ABC transporter ATP-binding protein n=1 Tax=Sinomonas terricola TaxID=3110330 RepID=A0ABU5T760_9MICC|nr:ABC transporter ATP-binding protein [Sinomonas sp. JGH33]MEA5455523.1 ABC transporter ATP-binding protein [Sinomonas sp. JGH33]
MAAPTPAPAPEYWAAPPAPHRRPRPVIALNAIHKVYGQGEAEVRALDGVSLTIERGEFVAIVGASGSGKSTMMNIIGCLDAPTSGRYFMDGIETGELDEFQLAQIRNRKIGFVFQSFNLIPRTRAVDNVAMPLAYRKVHRRERHTLALEALDAVGLSTRAGHLPSQLSGGQQQRVAIARALVTEPVLLLADEPTGALDTHSSEEILDLFEALHARGRTIVMITHEPEVAARAERVVRMQDGHIVSDTAQTAYHHLAGGAR